MVYWIHYGIAIEFRLHTWMKLLLYWNRSNLSQGIFYCIFLGRYGDDPLSVIEVGILGLEFAILDYSGMVFLPVDE